MKRILSLLTAVACLCSCGVKVENEQEKLEIEITSGGVSRTIKVNRDIAKLDLSESELTSITLPDGLTNLTNLNLRWNQLMNFTLKGLELYLADN